MSNYNWEEGTVKIPAKGWAKFRTELIKASNRIQLERFEQAKRAHARCKEALKGKRGSARKEALKAAARRLSDDVRHLVVTDEWSAKGITLKDAPKKKDFKVLPFSKDATLDCDGEGYIVLRNADRTVRWSVPENNRAVERAHESELGRKLFSMLSRVDWTRGSGGQIVYNDEYNRDCDYAGGGANRVTYEYGPEVQKRKARARMSSLSGPFVSSAGSRFRF